MLPYPSMASDGPVEVYEPFSIRALPNEEHLDRATSARHGQHRRQVGHAVGRGCARGHGSSLPQGRSDIVAIPREEAATMRSIRP